MTEPETPEVPDYYPLKQVMRLFKTSHYKMKERCENGEFDYIVTPGGRWLITRESLLRHLPELELKNNR